MNLECLIPSRTQYWYGESAILACSIHFSARRTDLDAMGNTATAARNITPPQIVEANTPPCRVPGKLCVPFRPLDPYADR